MSTDFKIVEEKNKIFKIEFSYANPVLINSLIKTRLIKGGTTTSDYKILKFKADSVKSLHQFQEENEKKIGRKNLRIEDIAQLISSLSVQLNYLISKESHTIIGYNPEHIIVINDQIFAFFGSELISKVEDNMALISYPFSKEDFYISPELLNLNELPSYVHYKTGYFSLGCLILYALLSDNDFYNKYLKEDSNEINIETILNLHPIKNTKLYWLLSRCLIKEAKERSILLI
jgi:serine/threonine protein kinase